MTALAHEKGAGLATDAPDALAASSVGLEDEWTPGKADMSTLSRGLDLLTEQGEAEWFRRIEVHRALAGPDGDREILLPGFTEADLRTSRYRPWAGSEEPKNLDDLHPADFEKIKRFNAILVDIARQHYARHWFYAHPMCTSCYDEENAKGRLGRWMLVHPGKFPADQWDDVVPPMPHEDEPVDFLTDIDLDSMDEPGWLLHEILPTHSTGVLRARDQSFKSFMALAMALEVVVEEGGKVLYCIGEGAAQFKHRRDAWLEHNGYTVADLEGCLHYLPAVPNLFAGGDLYDRVLARARKEQYDLIVIDTYARATAGSDINSQQDQSIVTTRVDELKRVSNGTVLLVAHSQKSDTDSSGSIEIEDARDFVFAMKRSGDEVTFEVTKQKDGNESAKPRRYVAKPVGKSIVLVGAGEGGAESIMTTKNWIVAALNETRGLGPRSEAQILTWINDHPHRKTVGPMKRGTLSGELSRMVGSEVTKVGRAYTLAGPSFDDLASGAA